MTADSWRFLKSNYNDRLVQLIIILTTRWLSESKLAASLPVDYDHHQSGGVVLVGECLGEGCESWGRRPDGLCGSYHAPEVKRSGSGSAGWGEVENSLALVDSLLEEEVQNSLATLSVPPPPPWLSIPLNTSPIPISNSNIRITNSYVWILSAVSVLLG